MATLSRILAWRIPWTEEPGRLCPWGLKGSDTTEWNVCLKSSCFLHDPTNVANLISGSSAFSKSRLYIWKFSVNKLLTPSLKDFDHYLSSM